jgi:hypothetical protein
MAKKYEEMVDKSHRILKSDDEEYDAKQSEQPTKKEGDSGLKAEAARWRAEIEGIDDPRLLSYIRDCVYAKESLLRAEKGLDKEPCKECGSTDCTCPPKPIK